MTATATDPGGNTSEFSQQLVFIERSPLSGPAGGRHGRDLQGNALRGRRDRDGRRRAGDERRRRRTRTTITATTPALPAGHASTTSSSRTRAASAGTLDRTAGSPTSSTSRPAVSSTCAGPQARPQRHHRGRRRRQLRRQRSHAAPADGRLPAEGEARRLLHAAAVHGHLPRRAVPSDFAPWIEALAAEGITGGCGGGNYCPAQSRPAPTDGGVPPEGEARLRLRAAALHRRLRRRALPVAVRRLDRAARRRGHHRRLRRPATSAPTQAVTRGQMAAFLVQSRSSLPLVTDERNGHMRRDRSDASPWSSRRLRAAVANTYTVTTTADSGAGSLRQAILDANANAGRRHDRVQHRGLGRPHDRARDRPARRSPRPSRSTATRSRARPRTRCRSARA